MSCDVDAGRKGGEKKTGNTFDEIRHGARAKRVRFARLGVGSGAEERFVRGEHLSAPYAGSSCRVGVSFEVRDIIFSARAIEGRPCDAVYIATVIRMSHEWPNNAVIKKTRIADVTDRSREN